MPVVAAGRTDTGVHAMGQAVHFDLPNADEDLAQLVYSMNQMLPAVRDSRGGSAQRVFGLETAGSVPLGKRVSQ